MPLTSPRLTYGQPPLSNLERGKANRKIANRRLGRGEVKLIQECIGITFRLLHSRIGITYTPYSSMLLIGGMLLSAPSTP